MATSTKKRSEPKYVSVLNNTRYPMSFQVKGSSQGKGLVVPAGTRKPDGTIEPGRSEAIDLERLRATQNSNPTVAKWFDAPAKLFTGPVTVG